MAESHATAIWEGDLASGSGRVAPGSGAFGELQVTWAARTERPAPKTSPEELLAAAHAACYAMALSHVLAGNGTPPDRLEVGTVCRFEPAGEGFAVTSLDASVRGVVPGLDQAAFARLAEQGEEGCPVSNALRGNVAISLSATLADG